MNLHAPNLAYRLRWCYAGLWAFMLFTWGCWLYEPYGSWDGWHEWWMPNHVFIRAPLKLNMPAWRNRGLMGVLGPRHLGRTLPALLLYIAVFVVSHWLFLRPSQNVVRHLPARRRLSLRAVATVAFMTALLGMSIVAAVLGAVGAWHKLLWSSRSWFVQSPYPDWSYAIAPAIVIAVIWPIVLVVLAWRRPKSERFWQYERTTLIVLLSSLTLAVSTVFAWKFLKPDWESEAGFYTALALALNVLLWAFGCRTILLFQLRRYQNSAREAVCFACGYDLRGTVEAGRRECPECGAAVAADIATRAQQRVA